MEFTTHLGLHSQATRLPGERQLRARTGGGTGLAPAPGSMPLSWGLVPPVALGGLRLPYATFPTPPGAGFGYELFPVRSPLLGESQLVSFPPLIYMLKFGG